MRGGAWLHKQHSEIRVINIRDSHMSYTDVPANTYLPFTGSESFTAVLTSVLYPVRSCIYLTSSRRSFQVLPIAAALTHHNMCRNGGMGGVWVSGELLSVLGLPDRCCPAFRPALSGLPCPSCTVDRSACSAGRRASGPLFRVTKYHPYYLIPTEFLTAPVSPGPRSAQSYRPCIDCLSSPEFLRYLGDLRGLCIRGA